MSSAPSIAKSRAEVLPAAALFAGAVALGAVGRSLVLNAATSSEQGVVRVVALFMLAGVLGLGVWAWSQRARLRTADVAFASFVVALLLITASYFTAELNAILFRADMLIWSESPFVNDIIKMRVGARMWDTPSNLDSFYYTPGSQALTSVAVSLAGFGESVAAMRVVQLLYVVAAVVMAARVARRLMELSGVTGKEHAWLIAWIPLLFLAATNSLTNGFTHLLHNDALSLAVCSAGFLFLTEYAVTRRNVWLVAMVVLPAAGFLVKQSLGIWCVLFPAWLFLFDRPWRPGRAILVGFASGMLVALTAVALYLIWGQDYKYWIFDGLGSHAVSPLRSIQHLLDGWAYFAVGLWAGWVLIRRQNSVALLGLWLVWLALFALETYTSGIAWMLNHMGPGSLIAAAWLAAALPSVWPSRLSDAPLGWHAFRATVVTALAVLLMSGLDTIRVPAPTLPADANRYASAIEREFEGQDPARVLLDHGSWVYLRSGVVQRDRSAAAGEVGYGNPAGMTAMIERLRRHEYDRILVRDLDGRSFMYDHGTWDVSSGVRKALLESYQIVRTIDGVDDTDGNVWLRTISVLEPRRGPPAGID